MNSYLSFFRLCVSIKSILMSWEQQEKIKKKKMKKTKKKKKELCYELNKSYYN